MAERTKYVVAAVSQLEVYNFPFCIPKYIAGFRIANNEVVYNL